MERSNELSRRTLLAGMAGAAGALAAGVKVANAAADAAGGLKGNIHHSVCKWCYKDMSLEDLCRNAAAMGIASVELLGPDDWPTVKKHGLTCAMPMGPSGIGDGWNRPADHDKLVTESERLLPLIKEAGLPNMIVFSGNRHGLADEEGMDNCAQGLKRIMALAERLQITVCMELLNSKVDHHDYQCDHTDWGVELCKKIGSERFKLLYDIYHMQIMEGDVVRTIRDNIEYIAHFHTGGVPGRHEIDETQELSYAFVAKAIVEAGFKGFMAQEFIPARDPMTSLNEAIHICDV